LAAEGGMRDALSILDQAISYSDAKIEMDDVLAVTGSVSQDVLTKITSAMFEQDTEATLPLFDEIIMNGKDPGRFVFDMIYFLRDILFYKTTPNLAEYLERAIVTEAFSSLTERLDVGWIQDAIVALTECEQQIKWTNSPRIFVEITILTITNRHDEPNTNQAVSNEQAVASPDVQQLQTKVAQLEKMIKDLQTNSTTPQQPAPQRRREAPASKRNSYPIPHDAVRGVLDEAEKTSLQRTQSQWANFLAQLKGANAPAHATIQNSKPAAASNQAVVVAFKYEIHCSLFLDHKETVESILANTLGNHLSIIPVPEEAWQTIRSDYLSNQEKDEPEEQKEEEPIVTEAQELFGDDIVEVQE
ncbi:MAG TPA: DNA polymerase III subunit gamma/tau, partial [Pseudogracilibacillus sp.]|nr:DNA polymerase III subunit gamma/tau [Pseudogracilibacillus sp.]